MGSDDWRVLTLRDAGVELLDCVHRTPPSEQNGYPYIAIPQLKDGHLALDNARRISHENLIEWTLKAKPQEGDVVLSRRCNPGETAVVPAGVQCALGQNLVLLRTDGSRVCPAFLRWLVRSPGWWEQVARYINVGAVFDSLKCADIPEFRLPIPPLAEQHKIASVLGALDDKIELNRRMNLTLQSIARAIFRSWFVDFDPVRRKMEGGEVGLPPDLAALFPDAVSDSALGELPSGWTVGCLSDVAMQVRDSVRPGDILAGTAYFGLEHLPKRSIALGDWTTADGVASGKSRFAVGDILFGKLRPYFHKVGPPPVAGVCSTDIVVVRPLASEFFALVLGYLSSDEFVDYTSAASSGTRMPRTSWRDMAAYPVAVPPRAVCSAFEAMAGPLVDLIQGNITQSRTLSDLRDTALPVLLAGELALSTPEGGDAHGR